jgi:hypothetical protein
MPYCEKLEIRGKRERETRNNAIRKAEVEKIDGYQLKNVIFFNNRIQSAIPRRFKHHANVI